MKILVASKNPVKIDAVAEAFNTCLSGIPEVTGMGAPSGV